MLKKLFLLVVLLSVLSYGQNQELNCNLVVEAKLTGNENVQVFRTLEKQLSEFVNNTKWTNKTFLPQERINCNMVIQVTDYDSDVFQAGVQISASRPVFNSTYATPIYNYYDRDFTFRYLEFQNLNYNATQFESNLVSVLAYHIYMILAMDAETFAPNGGEDYFQQARTIVNYSQQSNFKGWKPEDGLQSRYALIDNILSQTYKEFRTVMYEYHREGLDMMSSDPKRGKEAIAGTLLQFGAMNSRRPNSYILRVFFDAKAEEIEDIFSAGPSVNIVDMVETLGKVAPMHSGKWRKITF